MSRPAYKLPGCSFGSLLSPAGRSALRIAEALQKEQKMRRRRSPGKLVTIGETIQVCFPTDDGDIWHDATVVSIDRTGTLEVRYEDGRSQVLSAKTRVRKPHA